MVSPLLRLDGHCHDRAVQDCKVAFNPAMPVILARLKRPTVVLSTLSLLVSGNSTFETTLIRVSWVCWATKAAKTEQSRV
jgi:hypothetical protein